MSRIKRIVAVSMMTGGLSALSVPIASAVVNGEAAASNAETRSIVGIQTPAMSDAGMVDNCTGTVVAPDWILTASHCVGDQDSIEEVAVVANGTTYGNTTFVVDEGKNIKTDRVVFGKSQVFKPSDGTDLALIRLPRALPGISPATLASDSKKAGESGSLYGWGIPADKKHESGDKLSLAPSTIEFNGLPSEHEEYLGTDLGPFTKYSGGTYYYTKQASPSSAIQGDSGGPLMVDGALVAVTSQLVSDKSSDVVQGVLSTDVAAHADWIKETVGSSKASRSVDIAAGVGGVVDGKKVLPFTVANVGSDTVSDVNVEVSPPEGHALPVGSKLVVSKTKYTAGENVEFGEGESLNVDTYTPVTSSSNESRSFTVKVPVNLEPGEGVQLRLVLPKAVEGGDYRVLAYGVPGVRPAMFALDATNKCDQGADRDNCASVVFGSGAAKDALINKAGFAPGVKFQSVSSGGSEKPDPTDSSDTGVDSSEVVSPDPKTDTPKTDTPKTDTPKTDTPKTDTPKTDTPKTDTPKTDSPVTDVPETGETESQSGDSSVTGAPSSEDANISPEPSVPAPSGMDNDVVIEGRPDSRPKGSGSSGEGSDVPVESVGSEVGVSSGAPDGEVSGMIGAVSYTHLTLPTIYSV